MTDAGRREPKEFAERIAWHKIDYTVGVKVYYIQESPVCALRRFLS